MAVKLYERFADLPETYDTFIFEASRHNFHLTRLWLELAAEGVLDQGRLRLYALEDEDGRPQALLPLRSPAGQPGSVLADRAVGERSLAGLTNGHSWSFAPLISPGLDDPGRALRPLIRAACEWQPTVIDLDMLDRGPLFEAIDESLRDSGLVPHEYFRSALWYERIDGRSFEEYFRERPKNLKRDIPKRRRRLNKEHRVRFDFLDAPGELGRFIAEHRCVFERSWKGDEPFSPYIEELCRRCAERGALRMATMFIDDEPAAADITFVHNRRSLGFMTAYDERYRKRGVGWLITVAMLERLIDDEGVELIHFGPEDHGYKQDWFSQRQELWGLTGYNPRTARGAYELGQRLVRSAARPLVKPTLRALNRLRNLTLSDPGTLSI